MSASQEWFDKQSRELVHLESILEMLGWDQNTTMPSSGAGPRAQQSASLAALYHQRITRAPLVRGFGRARVQGAGRVDGGGCPGDEAEIRPGDPHPRGSGPGIGGNDFSGIRGLGRIPEGVRFEGFQPWLERILRLKRQEAACLATGDCPL